MDIDIMSSLSVGFFHPRDDENELWIQFKYERLVNFCYKFNLLYHITKKCMFVNLMNISTTSEILAKLYRLWLRVENVGCLLFVNALERENDEWHTFTKIRRACDLGLIQNPSNVYFGENEGPSMEATLFQKDSPDVDLITVREMQ